MPLNSCRYVGRFAPSPTGPLHDGSLVSAMASYLDARAHQGNWLLRIEDLDEPRSSITAANDIIRTLSILGFRWDAPVTYQSARTELYSTALARLIAQGDAFPCSCSRRDVARGARLGIDGAPVYQGTCRDRVVVQDRRHAWRLRIKNESIGFTDRLYGWRHQNLQHDVGDFVLRRSDGLWAYQLAVVVDDAAQEVTDVVRGADLLDSTPRQIDLQRRLGLLTPRYMHIPVVTDTHGEKLSKQTGAIPIDLADPLTALARAARHLDITVAGPIGNLDIFWQRATQAWSNRLTSKIAAMTQDVAS